uniref:Uncharacterized protein n=1 Tax=Anguilla anguilla TaxID=7936 RepID=A0A0E9VWQ9_ANGAN
MLYRCGLSCETCMLYLCVHPDETCMLYCCRKIWTTIGCSSRGKLYLTVSQLHLSVRKHTF